MAKVLLSIDDRLLARVDRAARARGLTRSAYLARLAAEDLDVARGPGASASAKATLSRLDALFADNPHTSATEAVRAERDAR